MITKYAIPTSGSRSYLLGVYDLLAENGYASNLTSNSTANNIIFSSNLVASDQCVKLTANIDKLGGFEIGTMASGTYTLLKTIYEASLWSESCPATKMNLYVDNVNHWFCIITYSDNNAVSNLYYLGKTSDDQKIAFGCGGYYTVSGSTNSPCGVVFPENLSMGNCYLLREQCQILINGKYAQKEFYIQNSLENLILDTNNNPVSVLGLVNLCKRGVVGLVEGANYDIYSRTYLENNRNAEAYYFRTSIKIPFDTIVNNLTV